MKKSTSLLGILVASLCLLVSAVGVEAKGSYRPRYSPRSRPTDSYKPSYQPPVQPKYQPPYQAPYQPPYQPPAPVAANYSCGPYMDTYVVHSLDSRQGTGIRCVKWASNNTVDNRTQPSFSWYGEGNWYSCQYRHVGQAVTLNSYNDSDYLGYSSDIMGNGECGNATYPGNLKINVIDSNTIRVTGAWNEEWNRVSSTNYTPLPAPTTCGAYFQEYRVMGLNSYLQQRDQGYTSDSSSGLRCMLTVGPQQGTWYGVGNWNGQTYSHLGMNSTQGYGASDFCQPGQICGSMPAGSLVLKDDWAANGYYVSGWNEMWLKR